MSKVPNLVRVTQLAKEHDPPVSREVMLRRLKKLEKSIGRKILHKGADHAAPWLVDQTYLSRMANEGGKNIWVRLRDMEREITNLTTDISDIQRRLVERGI